MKIFRLFTIAAAALILSACSSEDTAQNNNPVAGRQMHFTATIAAPNKGGTRTVYTEDTENKKITVAWKVDDEIALVHDKVMDVVKVKTVNADGSATIDGTITSATDEATVQLVYPAARVSAVNSDGNPEFNETVSGKLLTQDGTLTYIQNNIDFREGEGQLSVNGTKVTLNAAVDMVSSIAIWKLTLQDDAATPAALAATKVKIKSGENELASTATLTQATSTVYLALPCDSYDELTIEATVGEDTYSFTKSAVTLNASAYYQSTVTMEKIVDLSTVTTATTIKDGYTVTGTLAAKVKISIADGATVTLDGVSINAEGSWTDGIYAGITCEGDATIILKGTNTVKGFHQEYPGIYVPGDKNDPTKNKTLTIQGTGSLTASTASSIGNGYGAGIGGGRSKACGNIKIQGGTITATGGDNAAGIGTGYEGTCGDITISGGSVTATGGATAAGIGSGASGSCGNIKIEGGTVTATGGKFAAGIGSGSGSGSKCSGIKITTGVTSVTATKGEFATNSIGAGSGGTCGTVTIGGTVYWENNNYVGAGETYLKQSTILYPFPLSAVTSSQLGWIVGADGNIYADATAAEAASTTAVAMIAYVGNGSNCTHGLAIQLNANPASMDWSAACSYSSYPSITGNPGTWRLPSKTDWQNMFVGCAKSGDASASDNMNPIAGFKEKIGATGITWKSFFYWSSLGSGSFACYVLVSLNGSNAKAVFNNVHVSNEYPVLGCLAF